MHRSENIFSAHHLFMNAIRYRRTIEKYIRLIKKDEGIFETRKCQLNFNLIHIDYIIVSDF